MAGVVVVDYHKGNLTSVARGLARAGAGEVTVTDSPELIARAHAVVLPGVGSFYDAMSYMAAAGQDRAVLDAVAAGAPFLGICLGQQLLFDRGEEGVPQDVPATSAPALAPGEVFEELGEDGATRRWVRGLGLVPGSCTRLESSRLKVPHVGWDQVHITERGRACPLLAGVPEGANLYFTHSYAVEASCAQDVAALTHYARSFAAVTWCGNVFGCQFHPEKSAGAGDAILRNFVALAASGA